MSSKMMRRPSSLLNLLRKTKLLTTKKLDLNIVRYESNDTSKKFKPTDSFIANIYLGRAKFDYIFPYPEPLTQDEIETITSIREVFEKFLESENKPDVNDELEVVEPSVLSGLWDLGAFGLQVPSEFGGLGLRNTQYAYLVSTLGEGLDLGLGITLGAHQSIGFKGILLFGTPEQKAKYLPRVSTGREYAAFCLTEPSAGSDAASIKCKAVLSPDGTHFILNGSKIWISNGGIAEIMTVFAKTPMKDEKTGEEKLKMNAFIVERSFGGVTSGPPEKKMGIKASNTTEVFFENVKIPKENLLGEMGMGFKIAMAILNNGRFGMGAVLGGVMKRVTNMAVQFAAERNQFGEKLDSYTGVQEKITRMAMLQYVNECMAYNVSGLMDLGKTDYHLEAAASKIFSSESAWAVTDEAIQIMGGMGYMKHSGVERVLRDLRIFRIFEGTNDILRLLISLTSINHLGLYLKSIQKMPDYGTIIDEVKKRVLRNIGGSIISLDQDVLHSNLKGEAEMLGKCIQQFGSVTEKLTLKYKKDIVNQQNLLNRLSDATIAIYGMAVAISRCSLSLRRDAPTAPYEEMLTKLWCFESSDKVALNLRIASSPEYANFFKGCSNISQTIFQNKGILQSSPLSQK